MPPRRGDIMLSVITDSSSNILPGEGKDPYLEVMPLTIIFGGEEYRDGIDIKTDGFYEKLKTSREFPHTAQLNYGQIEEAVERGLARADEVLILPISSALSGSYQRCAEVAAKYKNVYVCDTKCTTVMLKMLVLEALENRERSAAEVIEKLNIYRRKIKLYAVPDTLTYLANGGRISRAAATLGSALHIKPVVTVNERGEVALLSKQISMSRSFDYICGMVDKSKIDYSKPVYLLYSITDSNVVTLSAKLGVKYTEKCNICPVIGAHIGPNAAGIVYSTT